MGVFSSKEGDFRAGFSKVDATHKWEEGLIVTVDDYPSLEVVSVTPAEDGAVDLEIDEDDRVRYLYKGAHCTLPPPVIITMYPATVKSGGGGKRGLVRSAVRSPCKLPEGAVMSHGFEGSIGFGRRSVEMVKSRPVNIKPKGRRVRRGGDDEEEYVPLTAEQQEMIRSAKVDNYADGIMPSLVVGDTVELYPISKEDEMSIYEARMKRRRKGHARRK